MLPKKKRVTKDIFLKILKEGKKLSTPLFLFYYIKNSDFTGYSFVSPKGIFKTAIKRNRAKRIGFNILREIKINKGLGIFVYKKTQRIPNKDDIKNNIILILKKVGFYEI